MQISGSPVLVFGAKNKRPDATVAFPAPDPG